MIDLDHLEALAKAATPGPYEVQTHYGEERLVDEMTDHTFSCVRQEGGSFEDDIAHFHSEDCPGIDDEANARYFAALDPESILALIAEVRALRERLEIDQRHPYDGIACRDETINQLDAEVLALREAESLVIDYVEGLITNDMEKAGEATKKMTNFALDRIAAHAKDTK